jgi:hypothetical protein
LSEATTVVAMTPDIMVQKYVRLRDKVAGIKKRHQEELAPFNLAMDTLEGHLLGVLNKEKAENIKVPAGTFYRSTRTSVTVSEWSKTLNYIRQQELWELLEARVNKTAAEAIMDETKQPIPGVNVSRETTVQIRRA